MSMVKNREKNQTQDVFSKLLFVQPEKCSSPELNVSHWLECYEQYFFTSITVEWLNCLVVIACD